MAGEYTDGYFENNVNLTSEDIVQIRIRNDLVRCIIVGPIDAGKSTFVQKICQDKVAEHYTPTVGVEYDHYYIRNVHVPIKLTFWDVSGNEKYYSIVKQFFKNIDIAIVMFDVTSITSFEAIAYWIKKVEEIPSGKIIIIGNKCDLPNKEVFPDDVYKKYSHTYLELSLLQDNLAPVANLIEGIARSIIAPRYPDPIIVPDIEKGCCRIL